MKKNLLKLSVILLMAVSTLKAQVYLTENFEGAFSGNPAAPAGWSQSRTVLLGDGQPELLNTSGEKDWMQNTLLSSATWLYQDGTVPAAVISGSNALWIEDNSFSTFSAIGSRRMESPSINLAASTNPYVRFWMFYGNSSLNLNLRVVASNDGGVTWNTLMFISPNFDINGAFSSTSPWQKINVAIPAAYKVANAKIGIELTSSWSGQNVFIDDVIVEEFTPTTITSLTSGLWNAPSTWVGGVVPNADNHVVIAATHTVNVNVNAARVQNVTVNGVLQYNSTLTNEILHVFGNLNITASGTYSSGSGGNGKKTYIGGNINNAGTITFQTGTNATGEIIWLGGASASTFTNSGTLTNGRIPRVTHANQLGVSYLSPVTISNYCGLMVGAVSGANLSIGNPALATTNVLLERSYGSFSSAPTFINTNVTSRQNSYTTPLNASSISLVRPGATVIPGEEIELVSGNRQTTGTFLMNTFNNVQLNYPLTIGTSTGGGISLTRGIIVSSTVNIVTFHQFVTGATGITPSTLINNGTNAGNHGSYVAGPLKMLFNTNTTNRTFPMGEGIAFHNNTPSSNVLRTVTLNSNTTAWNSQTITATIEGAPSGIANAPLTAVFGSRAYRLNFNGGPGLNAAHTLSLRFNNSTFGGSDNLVGNLQDIRLIQSPTLAGPWSERSLTTGTGPIVNDILNTRTSAATAPGPINNGDEYFAWGSTGLAVDMSAVALVSPGTTGCYGPNQTVSIRVSNNGIVPINFAANNATLSAFVSGAVTQTFTPIVLTTGTLAANTSQTVVVTSAFNMSAAGTYSFDANILTVGDNNTTNDAMLTATRSVVSATTLPLMVDFTGFTGSNLSTVFPGWSEASGTTPSVTTSNWTSQTGLNGPTNITARLNLWLATTNAWIISPKFTASANTFLSFDAALTAFASVVNTGVLGGDDKLRVMVSTDCGASFAPIYTISAADNLGLSFTNYGISLSAYAGQDIIVAFYGTDGPIDETPDMDIHIDNINIYNLPAIDAGITAITSPSASGCYSSTQPLNITLKNHGGATISNVLTTVVISGALTQTLNFAFTGTVASQATVNVSLGNINMSAAGTYSFKAYSTLTGDAMASNDTTNATRFVAPTVALPQVVGFNNFNGSNLPTAYPNWREGQGAIAPGTATTSNWTSFVGLGAPTNTTTRVQLFGNTYNEWIISAKITASANTQITFDAAVTDLSAIPGPSVMGSDDKVRVMVSTNCGVSYSPIYTISSTNSLAPTFSNFAVSLSAYAGQDIIVAFLAQDGPIDNTESYYFHLDNINIYNQPNQDAGVSMLTNPVTTGCYGANENVSVVLKNHGSGNITNIPVIVQVSGAVSQTINSIFTGTLIPSSTVAVSVGTLNMLTAGVYNFKAYSNLTGDGYANNDTAYATRNVTAIFPTPQVVGFTGFTGANLPTVFTGWAEGTGTAVPTVTTSNWANATGLNGPTNITARVNLFGATGNHWIVSPKITAGPTTELVFDAAVTDAFSTTLGDIMGSDDKVRVMVSTDCGASYTPIFTISATNSLSTTFTNFTVNLSSYAGQNIIVAFLAQDGPVDDIESYDFHLDNINLNTPVPNDLGVNSMLTPGLLGCYSASEPVNLVISNYGTASQSNFPVTVVLSGATNQTIVSTYTATIAPSSTVSFNVGNVNMTAFGTYSFNAFTGLTGDMQPLNDGMPVATRTLVAPLSLPYAANFNTVVGNVVPAGYTADNNSTFDFLVTNNLAEHGTGTIATRGLAGNLWSSNATSWVNLPKVGVLTPSSTISFDYRIVNYGGYANPGGTATNFNSTDSINLKISIDCGATFSLIAAIEGTNHVSTNTFVTKTYTLGSYAGNNAIFRFEGRWATGDWYFDVDNINICAGPPSALVANAPPICSGNSVVLTTTATGTAQWYTSPTATAYIATGNTYTTPVLNNNITYYLKDSTACGVSTVAAVNVTVNPTPTLTAVSSNSTICAGASLTLTAAGVNTYTWNTSATTSVIIVSPTVSSTYSVTGFSSLCNITQTAAVSVGVNALPSVSLVAGATTICASPGNIALSGSPNGGVYSGTSVSGNLLSIATAGTFNPVYTYTSSATGCSNSASVTVIVANCTGFNSLSASNSTINVYPNPNQGSFTIDTYNTSEKTIEIVDVTGRIVFVAKSTNDSIKINIADLANGIYQVKIKSDNELHMIKVIKQ